MLTRVDSVDIGSKYNEVNKGRVVKRDSTGMKKTGGGKKDRNENINLFF